ncbi:MAG: serine hydrolase domain-containing protein [Saprospiraceae bacterium]|nr:serine hydrolase domain-containing protein [Saprospiraceae bacterium]
MHRVIFLPLLIFVLLHSCRAQRGEDTNNQLPQLDSLITAELADKDIPSLTVGVVKDGEVVVAKGFGFADVEAGIPAGAGTIYQLGSVTKMFTGYLLATLIHGKHISLTDTLARFFPPETRFPRSPSGQSVTVRDIATHAAEFPRYPANLERIDPDPIRGYSREAMLQGIGMVSIDTTVGVRYQYSNFGYGVLGVAMENRMEATLADLMDAYIFSPYSMPHSSLEYRSSFSDNLAVPYLEVAPNRRTDPWNMEALAGAGNLFSCISDLNAFMIALLEDKEVNTIQQTPYLRINDTWSYGLGCFIIDSENRRTRIIYHGGDIDGYASSLTLYPEHKLGIVLLTNWGEGRVIGGVFTAVNNAIADHYLGEPDN